VRGNICQCFTIAVLTGSSSYKLSVASTRANIGRLNGIPSCFLINVNIETDNRGGVEGKTHNNADMRKVTDGRE